MPGKSRKMQAGLEDTAKCNGGEPPIWSDAERAAWQWPDALTISGWAQRYRVLEGAEYAEPGPWRNERNPLMADILDALHEPGVEEVGVRKAAQVGWSEGIRNFIGWVVDHEPGPMLYVLPDRTSAGEQFSERVTKLVRGTPAVARHISDRKWDTTRERVRFDTCTLHAAWAGSSQSTKSRPIRYALLDELDEFPAQSGAGGDPVSKVRMRLTTFRKKNRSKLLAGTTPTTRHGHLARFEAGAEVRHPWVPCPHCGRYQRLAWDRFRWPAREEGEERTEHAARVRDGGLCRYICEHCGKECRDRHHKMAMLEGRRWANEDQAINAVGGVVGPPGKSRRLLFVYPATYSPWAEWSDLASEFISAQEDPAALMDFVNQRLAEYFETISGETEVTVLEEKAKNPPEGMRVPSWAVRLIVTADTQGTNEQDGYFYYVVRAWGMGWRSQQIDIGAVSTTEELIDLAFKRPYTIDGGGTCECNYILIDSGGPRWREVYDFARQYPNHVRPSKGNNRPLNLRMVERRVQKDHDITLWLICPEKPKDQLHGLIHHEDRGRWELCDRANADYLRQMCSEHKILEKKQEVWRAKPGRPANHFWDCEAMQVAAAWQDGCGMTAPEESATEPARQPSATTPPTPSFATAYKGRY